MNILSIYYQEIAGVGYDKGLFIIDLYMLWGAIWRGVLIAIPIWVMYIVIKIKFLDWYDKRNID